MPLDMLHVHFGLGRLGGGLVLDILSSQLKLLIIQHRGGTSDEMWQRMAGNERRAMVLVTNTAREASRRTCRLIYTCNTKSTKEEVRRTLATGTPVIICTDDPFALQEFIREAGSLSTALGKGQDHLIPTLSALSLSQQCLLFPFENELRISDDIHGKIKIRPVIADRLCSGVEVRGKTINFVCESHSEVFTTAPADECRTLFGDGHESRNIHSVNEREFQLYFHRKRWLVNSVHVTVALLAYQLLDKLGVRASEWGRQQLPLILRTLRREPPNANHLDNIVDAEILRIIVKHPVALDVFNRNPELCYEKLKRYAEEVLDRMENYTDTLDRVFNFESLDGLFGKWEKHIEELIADVEEDEEEMQMIKSRRCASMSDIRISVTRLRGALAHCASRVGH